MRRPTFTVTQSIVVSLLVAAASVAIYRITFGAPETRIEYVEVRAPAPPPAVVVVETPKPAPTVVTMPELDVTPTEPPRVVSQETEEWGRREFARAVDLLREKQVREGCRILERIPPRTAGTVWSGKATSLFERRCEP